MTHYLPRIAISGLLVLGLASCNSSSDDQLPITSTQAADTVNSIASALSQGFGKAGSYLGTTSKQAACTDQSTCDQTPVDINQRSTDSADWAKQHLFNEAHAVASRSTATAQVFCLKADDVCVNQTTQQTDAKCVQALNAVPICARVTSKAAGEVDVAILVGSDQALNPANFHLQPNHVDAEAKLADLKSSIEALVTASGDKMPESFPTLAQGKIRLDLTKVSDTAFSASLGILEAIAVNVYPAEHQRHLELRVEPSAELAYLSVDSGNKQVEGRFDLKAIDLKIAADAVFGESTNCEQSIDQPDPVCDQPTPVGGALLMHLGGASLSSVLTSASDTSHTLVLNNVGLGDSTTAVQYSYQNTVADLLKIDLNKSAGRRLNITLTKTADGVNVKVSPSLELILDMDYTSIKDQLKESVAVLKAVYSVALTGSDPSVLFDTNKKVTQVVNGTLTLIDTSANTIEAGEGQCISDNDQPSVDGHPFANLVVDSCQD